MLIVTDMNEMFRNGFKIVVNSNTVDRSILKKIHPLMQEQVTLLVKLVSSSDLIINKIILFGSSISWKCGVNSDLDLCFFTESSKDYSEVYSILYKMLNVLSVEKDIFIWGDISADTLLSKEIEKGVVIYERVID